jgi:hypothetical protein
MKGKRKAKIKGTLKPRLRQRKGKEWKRIDVGEAKERQMKGTGKAG